MEHKILIIEDDVDLSNIIKDYLCMENYIVEQVYDGSFAIKKLLNFNPDLILLDIMLPNVDGVMLCKEIRKISVVPIIMLSAKSSDMDKIMTLGLGADDFISKPFSFEELKYRVKAQLRRYTEFNTNSVGSIVEDNMILDSKGYKLTIEGKEIALTSKEFKLLEFLMCNPNQVFTKEQLATKIWGYNEFLDDNTIAVYIARLRDKLKANNVNKITTVWGVGYKWEK